ncbi:hypothetical protein NHQ30_007381 [Ciborinia camelliae]|nr:hypothetical protein NHQ30_007381 [Ciborinia camelliae]
MMTSISNSKHLGVMLKASAKASPEVTLWCIAGAWGELSEETVQYLSPFDEINQAMVRSKIKKEHKGKVVWMEIDPSNSTHRRAVAYAFSIGRYSDTTPEIDYDNVFGQDMALIAFLRSRRAVTYEQYVQQMRGKQREPLPKNSITVQRNDDILPSEELRATPELILDQGMITRAMNRDKNSALDATLGRFVLRQTAELTNADIVALSAGVNNLIVLTQKEAGINRDTFLKNVFLIWNASCAPGDQPKLSVRIGSDTSIVCGVWKDDCYSQSERSQAKAAKKSPSEMGFPERPAVQKAGAEVLLKVRPGFIAPAVGFVNRNHQYGQDDNKVVWVQYKI